ncbi:MAG: hypothetical protein QM754_12460 [Tepidisphaeraceae bacterium]
MRLRYKFRRWHVIPALAGVALAVAAAWIGYGYVSFAEQFRRSEAALNGFAARVMANGPGTLQKAPAELGYFEVRNPEPLPNGFLFASNFGGPFDWNGLAFSTTPLPDVEADSDGQVRQTFKHVKGNWYEVFRP